MQSNSAKDPKVRVVYIASQGHSGSTLLAQLIGRHSKFFSLGEISNLRNLDQKCTCNAESILACRFWQEVDAVLRKRHRRGLSDLDLRSADDTRFREDNAALFRAVAAATNNAILVDSSKAISRLTRLQAIEGLDISPVYLRRQSAAVVNSNLRKGRNWFSHAWRLYGPSREMHVYFRDKPHARVNYTELAGNPGKELSALMTALGETYESTQLRWTEGERHDVGGNRMRFNTDYSIRLDDKWRSELSLFQRSVIGILLNDMMIRSDLVALLVKLLKPAIGPDRHV